MHPLVEVKRLCALPLPGDAVENAVRLA